MKTQALAPVSPASVEIPKRIGLFLLILALGWLVFGVFSHYFPFFSRSTDRIGRIVTVTVLLAAALAARRSERWRRYWLIPFAYFTGDHSHQHRLLPGSQSMDLASFGAWPGISSWVGDQQTGKLAVGDRSCPGADSPGGPEARVALHPARPPAPGFAGRVGCLGDHDFLPDPGDRDVFQR